MTNNTTASLARRFRKPKLSIGAILKYLVLIFVTAAAIFPVLIIVFNSFKTAEEYLTTSPFTLPKSFLNFENYKFVLSQGKLISAFLNTAILIIIPVIINIVLGTMTAYALERFDFKLKGLIMTLYTLAILIPNTTTEVATFSIIKTLGVYNTFSAGFILYCATDMIQISIYRQHLREIPYALDESARLDGASYFKVYRSIIFPLLKPATVTVIILKALGIYNELFSVYLYMPSKRTVSYTLYKFATENAAQWQIMSAAIVLALIPSVIVYFFAQKSIYDGIVAGSVK